MSRSTTSSTARGLGGEHRSTRAMLLTRLEDGALCWRCNLPMIHPDRCPDGPCFACTLDAGHLVDRALGGTVAHGEALEHRHCSRSAGARLGHTIRKATREATLPEW